MHCLSPLQWCQNRCDGVSNHQAYRCLLNRLFRPRSKKKKSAPRHWPLCGEITSDWAGEIPAQMANNAKMFALDDVIMTLAQGPVVWLFIHFQNDFYPRSLIYQQSHQHEHDLHLMAWPMDASGFIVTIQYTYWLVQHIQELLLWVLKYCWNRMDLNHCDDVHVSDHQSLDCLFNRLRGPTPKKHQSPLYWPFVGEFTGERWIPRTKGQ